MSMSDLPAIREHRVNARLVNIACTLFIIQTALSLLAMALMILGVVLLGASL